nr:protein translocase subunit SecF [uncultured Halomonas sp.]
MKPLSQLRIDFMGRRNLALIVSAGMLAASIGAILFQQLNLGLDFTGGTLVEVRYGVAPSLDAIRQLLEDSGFQDVSVQTFGASTEVLIRLQQAFDGDVGNEVVNLLRANGDSVNLVRAEFVGAQVGDQLRDQSGLGLLVALGVVMLYVAFRFQYKFALGALLALLHDVIIVVGVFALFQLEFSLQIIAAILAIIGYSLNDTIVVYDRIRENLKKFRKMPLPELLDLSVNETAPLSPRTTDLFIRMNELAGTNSAINSSAASQEQGIVQSAAGGVDEDGNVTENAGEASNYGESQAYNTESTTVVNSISVRI